MNRTNYYYSIYTYCVATLFLWCRLRTNLYVFLILFVWQRLGYTIFIIALHSYSVWRSTYTQFHFINFLVYPYWPIFADTLCFCSITIVMGIFSIFNNSLCSHFYTIYYFWYPPLEIFLKCTLLPFLRNFLFVIQIILGLDEDEIYGKWPFPSLVSNMFFWDRHQQQGEKERERINHFNLTIFNIKYDL